MIRFGPAASPRWFDQDLRRFREYTALIAEAGGRAIEFVLYPGEGSEELGRFHLLEPLWDDAIEIARESDLEVHAHAPLPPEFRLAEWAQNRGRFEKRYISVLGGLARIEFMTKCAPTFVVHAAGDAPEVTMAALAWMRNELERIGSQARIAIELRAPATREDARFDRDLVRLGDFIDAAELPGVGICWDIAHDWESTRAGSRRDQHQIDRIIHVHLHDSRYGDFVHAPLDSGEIPWRIAIGQLRDASWEGSIILEIRYRYAIEHGDPWSVLRSNLLAVGEVLTGE